MFAAGIALVFMGGAAAEGAATRAQNADFQHSLQSAQGLGAVFEEDTGNDVFHGGRKMLTTALGAWLDQWQNPQPAPATVTPPPPPPPLSPPPPATPPPPPPPPAPTPPPTPPPVVAPPPPTPPAPEKVGIPCNTLVTDVDFLDLNMVAPGTTTTDAECVERCRSTPGCNAISRLQSTGGCWVKSIPNGYQATRSAGFNSYRVCTVEVPTASTGTPPPPTTAPAAQVPAVDRPTPSNFFANDPRSNPHPDSSPLPEEPHQIDTTTGPRGKDSVRPLEQGAHAWFDYQVAEGYKPSLGTRVVDRDWFYGLTMITEASYSICNVNAFQTMANCAECDPRPDFTSAWPAELVTDIQDPESPGQFVIDISTPEKRAAAVAHVVPMMQVCEDKLFDGIEFDHLDAFMRFTGLPYTMADAIEYSKLLITEAHNLGLACGQKGAPALFDSPAFPTMGWDFAITVRCGELGDCAKYDQAYAGVLVGVEFTEQGFANACSTIGDTAAIVLRDPMLNAPEDPGHLMKQCGP